MAGDIGQACLLLLAVVLAVRWAGVSSCAAGLRVPRTRGDWWAETRGAGTSLALILVGFGVGLVIWGMPDYPAGSDHEGLVRGALTTWLAGPTEEALFLVAACVLLRRAGYNWAVVVGVSAIARVAFHVYYGPAAIAMLIWAAGVVLLYRCTGRVLGIVVAHALWDLQASLTTLGGTAPTVAAHVLQVLLVAVVAAALMVPVVRWNRRRQAVDEAVERDQHRMS